MADFKKMSKSGGTAKSSDPIEIYKMLDRKSVTGPLRQTQEKILSKWFSENVNNKDVIIKMHTGEGKTLVGLLMLQSKLNSGDGPCAYVCPDKYLVEQVCLEAKKFGLSYCKMEAKEIPDDFLSGRRILIVHVQKIFNGKSTFGISGNKFTQFGTILLDDSHRCVEIIRNASKMTIDKSEKKEIYEDFIALFEDDLKDQGEGSLIDLREGCSDTLMIIPYWKWHDKRDSILEIISKYREYDGIKFAWPLIKNSISDCACYLTHNKIEIAPYCPSASLFPSFVNAKNRILMSATTQDDAYSIKCLDLRKDFVENPLTNEEQNWYGEKMIIIPSLIAQEYDNDFVRPTIFKWNSNELGIVVLVPSWRKAEAYSDPNCVIPKSDDIYEYIEKLKKGELENILVVVNRYDGIDLPDDACRILMMDSMPYSDDLSDKYEEKCCPNSDIINKKLAQKVEQGLGRGVRGEKDYCAIIIIGAKLISFIKGTNTKKYFSPQTRKQVEIGLAIADETKKDGNFGEVIELINQSLSRDEDWKNYYYEEMQNMDVTSAIPNICERLDKERIIEKAYYKNEFLKAAELLQNYINEYCTEDSEKGWYLQQLARYYHRAGEKVKSSEIQQSAYKCNQNLLRSNMTTYKKIQPLHGERIQRVKKYLNGHTKEDLVLHVAEITENLGFGIDSSKFESSLNELGKMLGHISQRPEYECGKGPDNLWQVAQNDYFIFECKNQVKEDRDVIYKGESEQIIHSGVWFENEYGEEANLDCFLIIPTATLNNDAALRKNIRIIRKGGLRELRKNVKGFVAELSKYDLTEITDEKLQELLNAYELNPSSFLKLYSVEWKNK